MIRSIIPIAIAVSMLLYQAPALGQDADGSNVSYMAEAVQDALLKMVTVGLISQVEFPSDHYGLLGGRFIEGQTMTQVVTLTAGTRYVLVAGGDRDVLDSDILVRSTSDLILKQDTDIDASPLVMFTPPTTGAYRLQLRLYDSRNGVPSYCVLLLLEER